MTVCMQSLADTPALYFYGELDEASRAAFEQHLATCPDCANAIADLRQVRLALADRGAVARSPGEWNAFMRRLDAALERGSAPPGTTWRMPLRFASRNRGAGGLPDVRASASAAWLGVAAALLVGVVLGLFWQQRALGPRGELDAATAASESAGLGIAAERHFERAKIVVLGLAMKDPISATAKDWEYERELAASLLPETRLFRLSAEDRGDSRLAGLLGDLETVLLQAAMTADAETPELKRLQRIIRGRDLIVRMDTTQGI